MNFKTEFKRIFNDYLNEYDFTFCKDLNYFIRLDDEAELIFYIGYLRQPAWMKTDAAFTIVGGVVSLYYEAITLPELQWVEEKIWDFMPIEKSIFVYTKGDEKSMMAAIKKSAQCVLEYMLPKWKKLVDLESYIDYRNNRGYSCLTFCERYHGDSLVLIITNNQCDYKDVYNSVIKRQEAVCKKNGGELDELSMERIKNKLFNDLVKSRDKVFHDVDLLESALCEADKRKESNLMTLKKYKIV